MNGDPLALIRQALLNAIAAPESGGRYNVRYTPAGGTTFPLNGQHPRIYEPGPAGPSSAAGRYQFTWQQWQNTMGANTPFTPANQDAAALRLAQQRYRAVAGRDLYTDLQAGRMPQVFKALAPTWVGLGTNPKKALAAYYSTIGGKAPAATPATGAAPAAAPPPSMAAGAPPVGQNLPQQALGFMARPAAADPALLALSQALDTGPSLIEQQARRRREEEAARTAALFGAPVSGLAGLFS